MNLGAAEEPVIYIRSVNSGMYRGHDWFCLRNDDELSQKAPICKCGAVRDLVYPCFSRPKKYQPHSSVAAVGQFIYVFGGCAVDDKGKCFDIGDVSYINTLNPGEGWKVCNENMPTPRRLAYPINIPNDEEEEERVLLVGGFNVRDTPFAQIYYPFKHKWVASESFPKQRPPSQVFGHAVVREGGGDTVVLMHDLMSQNLFTYNLNKDSWGTRWENKFGERYLSGALVCGVLYVLNLKMLVPARVVLCGYQVSNSKEKEAKCLPVEILAVEGNKYWMGKHCLPLPDRSNRLPFARLLHMGDSKLAIVRDSLCFHDNNKRVCPRQSVYWSIFEMQQLSDGGGGEVLKLVARPLSHVCYHVYNNGCRFDGFVPVYPYQDQSKSPTFSLNNMRPLQKSKSTSGIDVDKAF